MNQKNFKAGVTHPIAVIVHSTVKQNVLRVIVRENQADGERWGSADCHHIFSVRYSYTTDNRGSIPFCIALIDFDSEHPLIYPHFDHEYVYFSTNFNTSQLQSSCMLQHDFFVSHSMTLLQTNAY